MAEFERKWVIREVENGWIVTVAWNTLDDTWENYDKVFSYAEYENMEEFLVSEGIIGGAE